MKKIALLVVSLFSSLALADGYVGTFYIDRANVKPFASEEYGIGDAIYNFNVGLGYEKNFIRADVHVGASLMSDESQFSQTVTDGFSSDTRDSSAGGVNVGFEVGPHLRRGSYEIEAVIGWNKIWASRSISDCIDCRIEQINIDSNTYIMPGVTYHIRTWGVGLFYQHMLPNSPLENAIRLSFHIETTL